MENNKLRVKPSNFKSELKFNEWAEKLGISTKCDYNKIEILQSEVKTLNSKLDLILELLKNKN